MTGVAGNAVRRVRRVEELGLFAAAAMTLFAALGILLRIAAEGKDKLGSGQSLRVVSLRRTDRVDVRFPWTVAGFAAYRRIVRGLQGSVFSFSELLCLGFVTGSASFGPGVACSNGSAGLHRNRGRFRRARTRLGGRYGAPRKSCDYEILRSSLRHLPIQPR